ncbi:hypothetical protein GCM10009730_55120 [Streptomyces albidochromogenes]|uniref:DUF4232 domain-containing protein n=1 Tax=Streptomyces albidochromogenes TaxID=329524 RepID=UPI00110FB86A|nr:DUF4232 domain-containing protein [Streptomyces albidochromogenes]
MNRHVRHGVRRTAFILAAVSALGLTACGPEEAPPSVTPPKTVAPSSTPPAGPAPSATPFPKPAPPSATPSSDPDFAVFPCSTYDLTFTATLAERTTSSYLLKITNKSGKPCKVLDYPIVTFGDPDGAATERAETHPGTDIRLKPGESAYAGLMGSTNDGTGRTVHSIAMTMNTASDLEQVPLKASTPGLYVSSRNAVTAWLSNAEDALSL